MHLWKAIKGAIFTARGYAKRGTCRRRVSVCVSVCVSVTLRYCITSGSAMAEGPREALVSRNSATYKTSHLKILGPIVWHYLQTDGQTDGQTHDDGMYHT